MFRLFKGSGARLAGLVKPNFIFTRSVQVQYIRPAPTNKDLIEFWDDSKPGSSYKTSNEMDHTLASCYHRNAKHYWAHRDSLIEKFDVSQTENRDKYVAVMNEDFVHFGDSLEAVRSAALETEPFEACKGVYFARIGYEKFTYVNDNLLSSAAIDDNIIQYGEVVRPHALEWEPQPRGSFKQEFRVTSCLTTKSFRLFVTTPILLRPDDDVEYPVTFIMDSGGKDSVLCHEIMSQLGGAVGVIHAGMRELRTNSYMKVDLLDLGPVSPTKNVNMLSEGVLFDSGLSKTYQKLSNVYEDEFGLDRTKWPIYERPLRDEAEFLTYNEKIVQKIEQLKLEKKIKYA